MKCPFCAYRVKKDEPLDLLAHVAMTHIGEVKALAERYVSSDVVWVLPTPEPEPPPETPTNAQV